MKILLIYPDQLLILAASPAVLFVRLSQTLYLRLKLPHGALKGFYRELSLTQLHLHALDGQATQCSDHDYQASCDGDVLISRSPHLFEKIGKT